jgi:hypothetical protein
MSTTKTFDTTGPGAGKKTGRNASTEAVLEAIQRPEQVEDPRYPVLNPDAQGFLPTMELPGFGETQEDCGKPIDFFCDHCYRTAETGRTCKQSTCKRCASAWCRDRAENGVAYLKALRFKRYHETGRDQLFHHVVLSPPSDWQLEASDPYEKTWDVVKEICAELGLKGYAGYHPWSGDNDVEDDRGEWKDRLFEGRAWENDVRSELKARPHFHVVGVSDFVRGGTLTKKVEEETGWVITRITKENSKKSIAGDDPEEELEDLASVASYVVSHTGLKKTDAGNYSAQWRNIGFKESDIDVYEDTRKEARKAVREVAWRTLGIPSADMRCEVQIPKGSDGDHDHDEDHADHGGAVDDRDLDSSAGTGDGSDGWAGSSSGGRTVSLEPCDGSMLIIAKAPRFIYDRSQQQHPRLEDLEELYEFWKEEEEWIG